jgi:methyl-accepting chemotaxis protein
MMQSSLRLQSARVLRSGLRPVSALRPAPGLTFPQLVGDAPAAGQGAASGFAPIEVGGGAQDIPLSARMLGAFSIVAFLAVCGAFITALIMPEAPGGGLSPAALSAYGFAGLVSISAIALGLLVARSVAGPVTEITAVMERLAAGDLEARLEMRQTADEIGRMTRAIAIFRDQAIEHRKASEARERERAAMAAEREKVRATMADSLKAQVGDKVSSVLGEIESMRALSERMQEAHRNAIAQYQAVDASSLRNVELTAEFASAVETLSQCARAIRESLDVSSATTQRAAERASQTESDLSQLIESAENITRVIELISSIAGQTKILALNAQVEAVRAGREGASFIVVAEEVKALSSQTFNAVEEVVSHVETVRQQIGETAESVRAILSDVKAIDDASHAISGQVEEQLSAMESVAKGAEDARAGSEAVRSAAGSLSETGAQTSAAVEKVDTGADQIGLAARQLQEELERYLNEIRNQDAA